MLFSAATLCRRSVAWRAALERIEVSGGQLRHISLSPPGVWELQAATSRSPCLTRLPRSARGCIGDRSSDPASRFSTVS